MAEQDKVYAICENKCLKETMTKEQVLDELNQISRSVFGIKKTDKTTGYVGSSHGPLPESNTRVVYLDGISYIQFVSEPTLPDSYYSEVVVQFTKISQRKSKPSDLIAIDGITVKWLNDDLQIGFYNVLHYYFTYDGINLCCWCTGYA